METMKYIGLCAAGLAVDAACMLGDWQLMQIVDFYYDSAVLFLIVGAALCIGSGFAHAAFMNIIRKRLSKKASVYLRVVFAAPLAVSVFVFVLALVLDRTLWAERTGFFNYSPAISMVIISVYSAAALMICWLSTICVDHHWGKGKTVKPVESDEHGGDGK